MTYDIFISYRRKGAGAGVAGELQAKLENLGYKVFLDVDEIGSGQFPVQNKDNICVKKDKENKCKEINKSDINTQKGDEEKTGEDDEDSQNEDKNDLITLEEDYSHNIHFSLSFDLLCLLLFVIL